MNEIMSYAPGQWAALAAAAVLIGLTKAGLEGGALIAVPLLAAVFGARASSGLLLGILMSADLVAVWSYRREPSLAHLKRMVPWAALGVLAGALIGGLLPERGFKSTMAVLILVSAVIMAFREFSPARERAPDHWLVNVLLGVAAGFASMVGNVAGAIMGLYLLSSGLGKGGIIGTSVWFFFIINLIKLPFHVFSWHTATLGTLLIGVVLLPVTVLSALFGVRLVRRIPEKPYRVFLICAAAAGGAFLLITAWL